MDFLKSCAARLDAGCAASEILEDMSTRYTTVRCMSSKLSVVRALCTPTAEYREAVGRGAPRDELPDKFPRNVRELRLTRAQMIECKRLGSKGAIEKNRRCRRVDGRRLLAAARAALDATRLADLVFGIMLATGRRTCELLNGRSEFHPVDGHPHSVRFTGIAKRRGAAEAIVIPTLLPAADVLAALARLRAHQGGISLANADASSRYQSLLSRAQAASPVWAQCGRVHGIRGVYACMALRLFDWGEASDAFVAMCILGHTNLHESLVYTTFHLGDDFGAEPRLGAGAFTPHS